MSPQPPGKGPPITFQLLIRVSYTVQAPGGQARCCPPQGQCHVSYPTGKRITQNTGHLSASVRKKCLPHITACLALLEGIDCTNKKELA